MFLAKNKLKKMTIILLYIF